MIPPSLREIEAGHCPADSFVLSRKEFWTKLPACLCALSVVETYNGSKTWGRVCGPWEIAKASAFRLQYCMHTSRARGQRSTALFILLSIDEWPEQIHPAQDSLLIAIRGDDWPRPLPQAGEAALKETRIKTRVLNSF